MIVADQPDDATSLARGLARYGHETFTVDSGAAAVDAHGDAELVLLDLELPDIDGLEVCRRIRATSDTPIIAFTDGQLDRVLGLQSGADDCLDKPYGFRELLARIDAVMRRSRPRIGFYAAVGAVPAARAETLVRAGANGVRPARSVGAPGVVAESGAPADRAATRPGPAPAGPPDPRRSVETATEPATEPATGPAGHQRATDGLDQASGRSVPAAPAAERKEGTLCIGQLTIDTAGRQVRVRGTAVELTRKEFDLLHYLATNSDTVISRQRLMAEVWGDQSPHAASAQASRTIDTHVSSLRGKLGAASWIRTVRGVGFRFDDGG